MNERTSLKTQCQVWKVKAEIWEQAFTKLLTKQDNTSFKEETPNIIRDQNIEQQYQAGEQFALKNIVELHKSETQGEFEVKNIWWDVMLNFLKDKALGFIIGTLKGLVRDQIPNMLKFANWLTEQLEDYIVNQYNTNLEPEYRGIIKNELKQYPQFSRLVEKLN